MHWPCLPQALTQQKRNDLELNPAGNNLALRYVAVWRPFVHTSADGMFRAVRRGDVESVLRFLEEPHDPDTVGPNANSAMHVAAQRGHLGIVRCFLAFVWHDLFNHMFVQNLLWKLT